LGDFFQGVVTDAPALTVQQEGGNPGQRRQCGGLRSGHIGTSVTENVQLTNTGNPCWW